MSELTGKRFGFVGAGVIAEVFVRRLLGTGEVKAEEIAEEQMAIATALTAVGPTYVFPIISALADAAIAHDLPPHIALPAACQVVMGAARLVAETERSPNSLYLMIGTRTLDEAAARTLFTQALENAHAKVLALEGKVVASGKG